MYQRGTSENLVNNTDINKKRKFEDTCTKGVILNLVNNTDIKKKRKFEIHVP